MISCILKYCILKKHYTPGGVMKRSLIIFCTFIALVFAAIKTADWLATDHPQTAHHIANQIDGVLGYLVGAQFLNQHPVLIDGLLIVMVISVAMIALKSLLDHL